MDYRNRILAKFQSEEKQFLNNECDCFGIYQLKVSDKLRHLHFVSMDYLRKGGDLPRKQNFDFIYYDKLNDNMDLDMIYEIFNLYRPDLFMGHSLSVSDIVVLHKNGTNTAFYVDNVGFVNLDWLSSWKEL